MTAETWLGATGWASGSQTCNGISPALVAEADQGEQEQQAAAVAASGGTAAAMVLRSPVNPPAGPARRRSPAGKPFPGGSRSGRSGPPRSTLSSSSSKITRKYDASDITSHATRNRTPLRAVTTMSMLAANRLKKNQMCAERLALPVHVEVLAPRRSQLRPQIPQIGTTNHADKRIQRNRERPVGNIPDVL